MRTELLDYRLPSELIASRPHRQRDGGRMCVVEASRLRHDSVSRFAEELHSEDLLVLNETRVRRSRLICSRPATESGGGGGRVELLFLHALDASTWSVLGKANRPLRIGDILESGEIQLKVVSRDSGGTLGVQIDGDVEAILLERGEMPIPPYMSRPADGDDVERYQTVFARELGSAAAPTAGLHLTQDTLAQIDQRGIEIARLTLHVGVGTFRPVSVDELDDHPMHREEIEVSEQVVQQVAAARRRGGRIVAIGTTVVRALESARDPDCRSRLRPTVGQTDLLIQPGYEFGIVDALWTNFHQPRSTLLALVAAFVGLDRLQSAYKEAVEKRYRFLSYGDAMWIPRNLNHYGE